MRSALRELKLLLKGLVVIDEFSRYFLLFYKKAFYHNYSLQTSLIIINAVIGNVFKTLPYIQSL